jgi:hypothetical protein
MVGILSWSDPTTNSPACPTTVQWGGKPGMELYGMVSFGEVGESASLREERPDPQL